MTLGITLPKSWKLVPFGELRAHSAFGPRFSSKDYADDGDIATLRTTDISDDGRISYETMPLAKLDGQFAKHFLKKGDLVITRSGTCGIAAVFTGYKMPVLPGAFLIRFRLHPSGNPLYYRYFFNSPVGRGHVLSTATGAVQQNLNITNLENLKVPFPPVAVQNRIVAALSAYDDLIENNSRRIAILEEMAQSLYREWFVNFRFPGHENAKFIDSPLGKIPEEWRVHHLGDVAKEIRRGVDPSQIDPNTPYFGLEHLPRRSITLGQWGKAADVQSAKLIFKRGEILFGKIRPYFHKVGVAHLDGVCSTDAIVIVPDSAAYFGPVVCCISSDDFVRHATQTSQGTKMPRANWDVLAKYLLRMLIY